MQADNMTTCKHCGSPYCYESMNQTLVGWKCLSCGFVSNSYMMKNTDMVKAHEETLPRLYVDLKFIDDEGFVWYPIFMDLPGTGIIFADGTSKDNWKWCVAPYAYIEEHEKEKFRKKDGTCPSHKVNMSAAAYFNQNEFPKTVEALGIL